MNARPRKDKKADRVVRFLCHDDEAESFKKQAEREGFGGNVSAWILWHLRRIIREYGDKPR